MFKKLIPCSLLYDFKLGLSTTVSGCHIFQALGDNVVNVRTERIWFQKLRSGDFSVCNEPRNEIPQALDDEVLLADIVGDYSLPSDELAIYFNRYDDTVRFHLHRLSKTYKLSKWVLHTLLEVHKRHRVASCTPLHRTAFTFN